MRLNLKEISIELSYDSNEIEHDFYALSSEAEYLLSLEKECFDDYYDLDMFVYSDEEKPDFDPWKCRW